MASNDQASDTAESKQPARRGAAKRSAGKTAGRSTKDIILDAALETVRREGIVGTSARAIARTGDFNQALVFYHFGSVEELLLAALQRANDRRMARVGEQLGAVDDLAGFVEIAGLLHGGPDDPDSQALSTIVAGWSSSSDLGRRVLDILEPWNEMIEEAVARAVADSPLRSLLPAADISYVFSALFIGIEMLSRLDPEDNQAEELFERLTNLAQVVQPLLGQPKS
ncbi:MAG: TetR/AcrR family transcriptional regulator [Acidimicrobiia bacterium]